MASSSSTSSSTPMSGAGSRYPTPTWNTFKSLPNNEARAEFLLNPDNLAHLLTEFARMKTNNELKDVDIFLKSIDPVESDETMHQLLSDMKLIEDSDRDSKTRMAIQMIERNLKIKESSAGRTYARIRQNLVALCSLVSKSTQQGGSNRASRAKVASSRLSKHAGCNRIEGVATNAHGNAVGSTGDLAEDGSFADLGLKVIILNPADCEVPMGYPIKWITEKGLIPNELKSKEIEKMTTEELSTLINDPDVCQVWVISTTGMRSCYKPGCYQEVHPVITEDKLRILVDAWKNGLNMYVLADNDPWNYEANIILKMMFPPDPFTTRITIDGNINGCRAARLESVASADEPDIREGDKLTTGLTQVYVGETVATTNPKAVEDVGGIWILREVGSDRKRPIVWYVPATATHGAVIVDGAFTKFWCNPTHIDSDRAVKNFATWLAVENFASIPPIKSEDLEDDPIEQPDFTGAFVGECGITYQEEPLYIIVTGLADLDPTRNLGDYVLNNAFDAVEINPHLLHKELIGQSFISVVLDRKENPFTRQPVDSAIPLLDLSIPVNKKLMDELVCHIFMGGKKMIQPAYFIFLSLLENLLYRVSSDEERAPFLFMIDQIFRVVKSTPTFTDVGELIPLDDAIRAFLALGSDNIVTDDDGPQTSSSRPIERNKSLIPIRKSFGHSGFIARMVLSRNPDFPREEVYKIMRRHAMKTLLGILLAYGKSVKTPTFKDNVESLLYERFHGIILEGGGRIVPVSALAELVPVVTPFFKKVDDMATFIGGRPLLTPIEITSILDFLYPLRIEDFSEEPLLLRFIDSPMGLAVWNTYDTPESVITDSLNSIFDRLGRSTDTNHRGCVPFTTGLSPSISKCHFCGHHFRDREDRNQHLKSFIPNPYSLNRAVQEVMTTRFPADTEVSSAHIEAVARTLIRKKSGYFYHRGIIEEIPFVIKSFLDIRNAGHPVPTPENFNNFYRTIRHHHKVRAECDIMSTRASSSS